MALCYHSDQTQICSESKSECTMNMCIFFPVYTTKWQQVVCAEKDQHTLVAIVLVVMNI